MRSFIIYEVEHGGDTDAVTGLLDDFDEAVRNMAGATFVNSTVSVDLKDSTTTHTLNTLLSGLSWEERAKVESGNPINYSHTHYHPEDNSPAMLVSEGPNGMTMMNEDGNRWTDPLGTWLPI